MTLINLRIFTWHIRWTLNKYSQLPKLALSSNIKANYEFYKNKLVMAVHLDHLHFVICLP